MRGYICWPVLLLSTVFIIEAKAQSLSFPLSGAEGVNTLQSSTVDVESTPAHVYGEVRMEDMEYLTTLPENPSLNHSQLLSARLSVLKETSWSDMGFDASAGTFFAPEQSHFLDEETYISTKGGPFKITVGRKKKDWSEMDDRWKLGLWQPVYAIDTLRPEEEGLSGVFFDYNKEDSEVLLFVTPLYLPNTGPDIRSEGGSLVSDSRWYRPPTDTYDFNDRMNTINYNISIPNTGKIVNNAGVGVMGRLGSKNNGPWAVSSFGYLPVNELALTHQIVKEISQDDVNVTIVPQVVYHSIASADVGYSFSNLKLSLSYLEDQPLIPAAQDGWAIQDFQPIQAYSAAADFSIDQIFSRLLSFQVSYLKVNGGGIQDMTSNGTPDDITLFDERLKFTNAASFRVEGQLATLYHHALVSRLMYLYDYDQRGSLLNTEFLYYPAQKWALLMGADFIGVEDDNYKPTSFLNTYRANDRVYGGMTYVF